MIFGRRKSILGIDIGTTSLKAVELAKVGSDIILENYVEYHRTRNKKTFPFQTSSFSFFEEDVAGKLKEALSAAEIKTKDANFSLPSFSGFFTVFDLPKIAPEEIEGAIKYQSYQYIPLPIQEVVLDWEIISESEEKYKILLTAIPKDIIEKHRKVALLCGLNLKMLEVESFSEVRSLVRNNNDVVVIVNIGDRATNITVVDGGKIRVSHSLDFAGFHITKSLSETLNISFSRAEDLKRQKGLKREVGGLIAAPVFSVIDKIVFGTQKAINIHLAQDPRRQVQKIILSGASANMPGIVDYFCLKTNIKTEIARPFDGILYDPALQQTIEVMGPSFAVAVGLALSDFLER